VVHICFFSLTIKAEPIYFDENFKITSDENTAELITNTTTINRERKSVLKAELYSLGAIVLPLIPTYVFYLIKRDPYNDVPNNLQTVSYVLASAGLIIGPIAGHFYLRDGNLSSTSLRATTALTGSLSALFLLASGYNHSDNFSKIGYTGICISGIVFLGATIYDFAAIPFKVNNYNENLRKKSSINLIPGYNFEHYEFSLSLIWIF
jgi:hypothetical protein